MRTIGPIDFAQAVRFVRIEQGDSLIKDLTVDKLRSVHHSVRERVTPLGGGLIAGKIDTVLRMVRIVVGLTILLTILTAILIPQVLPVSGDSFVNAKLEWIRTPIEGDLDFGNVRVGDKIKHGAILGTVTNQRVDDSFLNQLNSEKSGLESLLLTLEQRQEHLSARHQELTVRAAESLMDLKDTTRIRVELIENEMFTAREELGMLNDRMVRYQNANTDYSGDESFAVVSRARIESLADRKMELQALLASRGKTMSLLQSKLDSAIAGTFVSDDTPLEQQQLFEVNQSLARLASELSLLQLKSVKLLTQIETRKQYVQKNTHYQLVAGVSGTVWDTGFPDGSYVNRGDSVVAIADTDTVAVEGNFHQRYLDNIKIGDPATIDLMGSTQHLTGTVSEVKIRDQVKSTDLSAFNLDNPETNEFKVVVSFDSDQSNDFYIGQRAKLIISKSASSFVPSLLLFFNR